jgi:hypothetical protein
MIDVRRIDFIARPTDDLRAADAWHGETLGLARNPHASGEQWVEYETGNFTVALSQFGGSLAFGVDDVEESRARLEEAGVEFAGETFDSGVCHGANFKDPFGNPLQLHHRYAPLEPYVPPAQEVERTDFVGVAVTDRDRAIEFYGGPSGCPATSSRIRSGRSSSRDRRSCSRRRSRRASSSAPARTRWRCASPTSPPRWSGSRRRVSASSRRSRSTRASATWGSSPIPTATRSSSITATRPLRTGARPDGPA